MSEVRTSKYWRAGCECNRVGLCLRCQAADEIERLQRALEESQTRLEFYASASKPAPAPEPLPANTGVGDYCTVGPASEQAQKFLLMFEDADRGVCIHKDEAEARTAFARAEANGWNCHLFGLLRRAAPPPADERSAFEQWCKDSGHFTDWTRYGDGYAKPLTDRAWKCWQAARASLGAAQPPSSQRVRLLKDIWDDGEDHPKPAWMHGSQGRDSGSAEGTRVGCSASQQRRQLPRPPNEAPAVLSGCAVRAAIQMHEASSADLWTDDVKNALLDVAHYAYHMVDDLDEDGETPDSIEVCKALDRLEPETLDPHERIRQLRPAQTKEGGK